MQTTSLAIDLFCYLLLNLTLKCSQGVSLWLVFLNFLRVSSFIHCVFIGTITGPITRQILGPRERFATIMPLN